MFLSFWKYKSRQQKSTLTSALTYGYAAHKWITVSNKHAVFLLTRLMNIDIQPIDSLKLCLTSYFQTFQTTGFVIGNSIRERYPETSPAIQHLSNKVFVIPNLCIWYVPSVLGYCYVRLALYSDFSDFRTNGLIWLTSRFTDCHISVDPLPASFAAYPVRIEERIEYSEAYSPQGRLLSPPPAHCFSTLIRDAQQPVLTSLKSSPDISRYPEGRYHDSIPSCLYRFPLLSWTRGFGL